VISAGQLDLQHILLRAGGVDLHAVAAGPADGPLVILLHGFPEFWYGWRRQIAPLAAAGFRVVVPDQRGYGTSARPAGIAAYGLDVLAADVVGIADACGAEKFDVAGHDWGGIVAWWTALIFPHRVRRLIVVNAPHPVAGRRYARQHWRQLLRSWYIVFFQIPHLPEWFLATRDFVALRAALTHSGPDGLFTAADLQCYREAWAQPGALTAMLNWYRAFPTFRARGAELIVRQPTLVLWGDRDLYLDVGLAEASLRFCANGRLLRVEGASHWLQHERPSLVAEEIVGYLGTP
jgi:pimeloyl-ACP methyl ester carboxylesterase